MKASELRIGNLIQDDSGKSYNVTAYQLYTYIVNNHRWYQQANPIPLTEEWLVKFGFKPHPISYDIDISIFPDLEFKTLGVDLNQGIFIRQGDLVNSRIHDDVIPIWNIDKQGPIPVHIIQNLYHVLTGQELEIKDNATT